MEYKLILASASPRRHQLMCDAGFKFEVRLKHTEEIWPEGLAVEEVPDIWLDQARQFQQVMMHYTCAIRELKKGKL